MNSLFAKVSVPLPGFSGLRHVSITANCQVIVSVPLPGFSGLRLGAAGYVASVMLDVSVPLPGFSGLRHLKVTRKGEGLEFQSRCRDSVG